MQAFLRRFACTVRVAPLALVVLAAVATVASAAPRPVLALSRSVGSPNEGHLIGGMFMPASHCVRGVGTPRWGLPELVRLVSQSSGKVAEEHPGTLATIR